MQSCVSLQLGLDMAALDEVGNALEDVGHLAHHPQPLLHEGEQLSVLLRSGTLLNPVKGSV